MINTGTDKTNIEQLKNEFMKKLFKITLVAAFVTGIGYNIYTNQKTDIMSDLMLANVGTLANDESGTSCTVSASCSNNSNDYISCTVTSC